MLLVITISFFLICSLQTLRIFMSRCYLQSRINTATDTNFQKMFILIPVFNEQNVIEESVKHFSKLADKNVEIIYITTAKEKKLISKQTTHDILLKLKTKYPISIINCPIIDNAVMAHQLNYAIKKLKKDHGSEFIIALYNVDSRIDKKVIKYIQEKISKNKKRVFQQFTKYNLPRNGVLSHISLWQTRWTLHFELGRLLFDHKFIKKIYEKYSFLNFLKPFHYVIGHGLFMHFDTWDDISGFPQDESNEDAFLGLLLYFNNYEIETIPYLEKAEIAKNIDIYIRQQSIWYNGPLFAFRYLKKSLCCQNNDSIARKPIKTSSFFAFQGACKLFSHAIYWLCGPIFIWIIFPLICLFRMNLFFFFLWISLGVYHCYVLNIMTFKAIQRIDPPFFKNCPGNIFSAIAAYILHSIGPTYCLIKTINGTNTKNNKYKTEK